MREVNRRLYRTTRRGWVAGLIFYLVAVPVLAKSITLGSMTLQHLYHASVWITVQQGNRTLEIAVDPSTKARFPQGKQADLVLITDIHFDHYDPTAIKRVAKPKATLVAPPAVAEEGTKALKGYSWVVIKNGERKNIMGIHIEAVPMYNTSKERLRYHPRGRGNGYIVEYQGTRIYLAGDTQCTKEMRALTHIDLALVPINLPYTMDAREAAECVAAFKPKRVMPYHFDVGEADPRLFQKLVQQIKEVEFIPPR